ncbi:50S ribosomal protein L11 methyltransferase [Desulfonema ishimotonii]|uniref:50S ribosomal protein L11 methyltransferase n=1 Tax=Desulfonema ishimotonii TaxID=45657 RepID=A0A401FYJ0_9BACT|nr:50S ribosomal protein L11 methyltransferase [Desulfonema ishimotonii]GBC62020.1 50S ribosomal protein L11 methyltransferase [Desulfonema ishimotonii]
MTSEPEKAATTALVKPTDAVILEKALALVEQTLESFTPGALKTRLSRAFGLQGKAAKAAIRQLINRGDLVYTDRHGRTVIEKSFCRAVRVSERVVLTPPGISFAPRPQDVVVRLSHGASFGTGHHPTTRMSVRGIDHILGSTGLAQTPDTALLDIGTGSGVLAVTALALGIGSGIGLDIDPCAVSEARSNAELNGFQHRLKIAATPLEKTEGPFTLIIANLRFPTLKQISPQMVRLAAPRSALVLSGIRAEELSPLKMLYTGLHFRPVWEETEKDWAAVALVHKGNTA